MKHHKARILGKVFYWTDKVSARTKNKRVKRFLEAVQNRIDKWMAKNDYIIMWKGVVISKQDFYSLFR